MTLQYRHDIGRQDDLFSIALHGGVRAREFVSLLAAQGRMRIGCIDLTPADRAANTTRIMRTGMLRFEEIAPSQSLPGGHSLRLVEIHPGG